MDNNKQNVGLKSLANNLNEVTKTMNVKHSQLDQKNNDTDNRVNILSQKHVEIDDKINVVNQKHVDFDKKHADLDQKLKELQDMINQIIHN